MAEQQSQPWSWPEEKWRAAVERGRAGRSLRPKKWKGGRCAVALTFDCDFETLALSAGEGVEALSRGQYGARAGLPRLLRLLKRHAAPATFFMPAISALLHGEAARAIAAAGHEIGLTSWIGEARGALAPEAERELLAGALSTLETAAGLRPGGFRAGRGGFSDATLRILKEIGVGYDSSLSADDDPYELTDAGEATGIVELPVAQDDADYFEAGRSGGAGGISPEEVFDIFRRELEIAYDEGGLLVLRLHPEIIGRRSRVWIVEEFVKVARTLPGVWLATLADIAASARGKGKP